MTSDYQIVSESYYIILKTADEIRFKLKYAVAPF